ncbi:MAG: tetraacyldisaccharide 4'-kinase [Synergistaceae bacterium]|nr:tetraacyldisaccharide 4'-kinase [Synergistaceae bacterium]
MRHVRGLKPSLTLKILLAPASWIMAFAVWVMDFLRARGLLRVEEPSLPVISVGNLTYGGTNKTPSVRMLAEWAMSRGIKAGIVTRGYSGKNSNVIIIQGGNSEREIAGDEPLMLSRELPSVPVAVAKKRIEGVNALRELGVELVIADDAFQHRAMSRDCDIVLIDALCPFGNGELIPGGILREKPNALKRARIIIITKSDMIPPSKLSALIQTVRKYSGDAEIFTSCLKFTEWLKFGSDIEPREGMKVCAFSAIGSPESFRRSCEELGLDVAGCRTFTDHHRYTPADMEALCHLAENSGAEALICTEKDLYNLPEICSWPYDVPLIVPRVKASVNEPGRFYSAVTESLRPRIIVASNGYGEDAIGSVLVRKLRREYPHAEISAFPLVGRGEAYSREGFPVKSAPSVTPSGGVVKYSLKDLWGDMRAGLMRHVRQQLKDWRNISHSVLTPICTGDVYLLLHTLYGSGRRPLFMATAKTVYISGHWRTERIFIRSFTLRTWTRDEPTANQIGDRAVYSGSPIMDLSGNAEISRGNVILLLPGSRRNAANDVKTLLGAVEIMHAHGWNEYRMVLAPTLEFGAFFDSCMAEGWTHDGASLTKNGITIELSYKEVTESAGGVKILLGMGGTANQLCAGLGIPVIAPDNKGKRVQKKLLGDSEILTSGTSRAIAECALRVLNDPALYDFMSRAGRERMGFAGACDDVVSYTRDVMGWGVREDVYSRLTGQ